MANIITADFNGISVTFKNNAYLNASEIAAYFGKAPKDYLKTEQTQAYIAALAQSLANRTKIPFKENQLVTVKKGAPSTGGGTWLHPKLAVHFARWLSPEFAVWCDAQIERILGINQENHEPPTLTREQWGYLYQGVMDKCQGKGKFIYRSVFGTLKRHFGVAKCEDIKQSDFVEACNLLEIPVPDFAPKQPSVPAHIAVMDFDTRRDGEWRVYIRDGKAYRLAAMYATVQGDPYAPREQA